jgi:ribosome-binding factor A
MAGRNRAPSQRQLRVGEELRHVISGILSRGEIRDPDVEGVVLTVTEVRASPDLKYATVFIAPLGGGDVEAILAGLKRSSKFVRGQVARQIRLRNTPQFVFELDTSFDTGSHIDSLLHRPEVQRDLGADDNGLDDLGQDD